MTMKTSTKNLVLAALFLALGLILPFLTGQIPQIGSRLLPMHIPILLCGLICGWKYGGIVGFVTPLLRSVIFGMPPFFPTATAMAFELLTYGLVIGLAYGKMPRKNIGTLYAALVIAMVAGRVVWGIVQFIQLGISGTGFTWQAFMAGAFLNAIPGIILQLILIPALMVALDRMRLVKIFNT
jgi:thiamine transporter ThiT